MISIIYAIIFTITIIVTFYFILKTYVIKAVEMDEIENSPLAITICSLFYSDSFKEKSFKEFKYGKLTIFDCNDTITCCFDEKIIPLEEDDTLSIKEAVEDYKERKNDKLKTEIHQHLISLEDNTNDNLKQLRENNE